MAYENLGAAAKGKTPQISRIKHGFKMKYNSGEICVMRGVFLLSKPSIRDLFLLWSFHLICHADAAYGLRAFGSPFRGAFVPSVFSGRWFAWLPFGAS